MSSLESSFPRLRRLVLVIFILSIISNSHVKSNGIPPESWEAELDENEKLALDAIKCLHRQLDDDKDGNINLVESNEFLREELKYERDYEKRQKAFHINNDNQVTVRELWETWVTSEVHNWTNDQTIEWLLVFVGLPQYSSIFDEKSINGTFLPRLAVNHQQFLSSGLGIKDMIHRNKISLKAQDVVLFGPPKEYTNYVKDVILTSLLVIAIGICWNVSVRYKSSQRELSKIMKDMEGLAKAEKELQDLQNVMEKTKVEHEELSKQIEKSMSQKCLSELDLPDDQVREEITRLRSQVEVLRSELQRTEVELQDKCWVPPPALQHWLQLTYELELKTYNRKKQSAERQLRQAKEACDKLKKKRSSLMGAFVSTHGKSIDDVDKAILEAKGSLTEITHELQERMNRWKQIEVLTNCPIMSNPGLHYLDTVLRGYGKVPSYGGPSSVISNSQDDIEDDAASSVYSPSAVNKLVSTSTCLMFAGGYPSTSRRCSYQLPLLGNSSSLTIGSGACLLDNNNAAGLLVNYDRESKIVSTSPPPTMPQLEVSRRHDEAVPRSVESNNTVSTIVPSSHAPGMPRSRSVGNMQNLRSGREMIRETLTVDEDHMPTETLDIATSRMEKDRRVKFGTRPENRIGENIDMERKQNVMNGQNTQPPSIMTPEGHGEEQKPKAFHSTEKPDLIKVSSYPEVHEEGHDDATEVTSNDLNSKVGVSAMELKEDISVKEGNNKVLVANGVENAGNCSVKKVQFSGKVGVLRSISRLVAHGSESLRAHRIHNYKIHASDNDKVKRMDNVTVDKAQNEDEKIPKENNTKETLVISLSELPLLPYKKPRLKLFSSFRKKKLVESTPTH